MKMIKIDIIVLVVSFCFAVSAQSLTGSKANAHLPGNDLEREALGDLQTKTDQYILTYFKVLANKDKVFLKWTLKEAEHNFEYKIYRSENGRDNFVLISSSKSNPHLSSKASLKNNDGYCFNDLAVAPGITYWYKLVFTDENGQSTKCGPISASIPVQRTFPSRMVTTSPSRFRFETVSNETDLSATTLRLDLPYQGQLHHSTKISIYGPKGERVKTIYKGPMEAGSYHVIWNGDTERGEMVSGGVFFAVFENDFVREARKLVLIK